ncbi:MAG: universal stress protein [Planctomycetota bacterium]|nr:MAG: universal stress protein [Planctomycetota bacterium]
MLVPVDFSEHAKMAFDLALGMVRAAASIGEKPQVTLLNVGTVGYGYKKVGLSLREATQQLIDKANEQLDDFLKGVDTTGVDVECIAMCAEDDAEAIHELGVARKVDMIVIGSRGLTASAAALLGSTTERVLVRTAIPLLVAKRKGETVGLLNALLSDA